MLPELAKLAKPHGAEHTRSVIALCTRLANRGMMHRGLLLAFAQHYLENHARITNVFAYYSPGGAGFGAMKMRLSADMASAEHEEIKRAELAWKP
jgi:hypothetical protein